MTGKQAHVAEAMCAFDAKLRGLMLESGLFPDQQTIEDFGHRLLGVVLRILMDAIESGNPPSNIVRIGALGSLIQESVNRMLAVEHDMAEMRKRAH